MRYILPLVIMLIIWPQSNYTSTQPEIQYSETELKEQKEIGIIYDKMVSLKNVNDKNQTDLSKLSKSLYKYSKQFNIDSNILIGMAYSESRINKYATSGSKFKCIGIFQLNETVHNLDNSLKYDEDYQTLKACEILSYTMNKHKGNITLALNAYNGWASYNNKYANKVLNVLK